MESFEDSTHSFVVKITVADLPEDETKQTWQGEITHVASGSQLLFTQWEKMESFLKAYLKEAKLPTRSTLGWAYWRFRNRSHLANE